MYIFFHQIEKKNDDIISMALFSPIHNHNNTSIAGLFVQLKRENRCFSQQQQQ